MAPCFVPERSALSSPTRFKIDSAKPSRELVEEPVRDPGTCLLVDGIVTRARKLGM